MLLTQSWVFIVHDERCSKKTEKHAPSQAGLKFRGWGGNYGEPELVGKQGVMDKWNAVPRITNLARRGWRCPRPWQTCWSLCKRRRRRPRAGRSELSGCRWSPWPGWAASRCPSVSTPGCRRVTVERWAHRSGDVMQDLKHGRKSLQISYLNKLNNKV